MKFRLTLRLLTYNLTLKFANCNCDLIYFIYSTLTNNNTLSHDIMHLCYHNPLIPNYNIVALFVYKIPQNHDVSYCCHIYPRIYLDNTDKVYKHIKKPFAWFLSTTRAGYFVDDPMFVFYLNKYG